MSSPATPHSHVDAISGTPILLVDDDAECRHAFVRALRRRGYTVSAAGNGAQALAVYAAVQPELVVTDLVMPGIDGVHLIEQLQQVDPSVNVLVVTGVTPGDPRVHRAVEAGARAVLFKPFTPEELDGALDTVFA